MEAQKISGSKGNTKQKRAMLDVLQFLISKYSTEPYK
jgi:hypothetical protein